MQNMHTTSLFGFPLENCPLAEAAARVISAIGGRRQRFIFFINAEAVMAARRDRQYAQALHRADATLFADGVGMQLAARRIGQKLENNVNGTDLFPLLCRALESTTYRIFLLGGHEGAAKKTSEWIKKYYPKVHVAGFGGGFFDPKAESGVIRNIRESKTDLLLVGMGTPRQEKWLTTRLKETGSRVGMGVGGLFDYYSGNIPRAPKIVRTLKLEWLWRLIIEPRRIRRQIVLIEFMKGLIYKKQNNIQK